MPELTDSRPSRRHPIEPRPPRGAAWRRAAATLAVLGALVTGAAAPSSASAAVSARGETTGSVLGIEMKVKHFTLGNGLRVFVLEDHSTPMFAMHIAYHVGSRDEQPGRTGFAHLFEHMMFKGSGSVPDGGHFKYINEAGGTLNAFTTADVTQYHEVVPSHYLDMVLWLESDRLRSLAVTDENFENQRAAVKEEKAMRYDNRPYIKALRTFFSDAWAGTGYGHTTIGSEEDLSAAATSDIQGFFDTYYVPNNAVMAIVGDVDYAEVERKVDERFGNIPRGPDRAPRPAIDHSMRGPYVRTIEDPLAPQPLYLIGWKTVPTHDPDHAPVRILMSVLLRGDSSRITRLLKDERRMVVASVPTEGIGGGIDAGVAAGAFVPSPGHGFDAIKAVVKAEVGKVKKRGISPKELQKAINQLTVDTVSDLATNNGRARGIAQGALFYDDPVHALSELESYRKVTPKDIKRVANRYLTDDWLTLEIVPKR
ncbi:M16 family metallopeptidase [Paraliomyxa miuraensis]|uniref:M16 family metallopeptidase n=1 Tax=Paraliomyxa miuraensis TaxID=376150 RepID=UPI002252541E|nr:pitrilysin family protein [Paraliomyxa miuraensis]MCX4247641.1 insulinase family protein [Paraliomyxa miuraensis]